MTKQRGFSLIEIAIVLVIIGLLLGGVLQGARLFDIARTQDLIASVQDMQAATLTFKQKYGFLPGDLPTASKSIPGAAVVACSGNGDGLVGVAERTCAVNELILSGLIKGTPNKKPPPWPVVPDGVTLTLQAVPGGGVVPANWVNVLALTAPAGSLALNCDNALQLATAVGSGTATSGNSNLITNPVCAGQNAKTPVTAAYLRIN